MRPEDLGKEVAERVENGISKELLERFIFPVIPAEDRWDEGIWKNEVHHTEVWEDTLRFHLPPGAEARSLETKVQDNMLRIKLQKIKPGDGEPTNSKPSIPKRFLM